MLYLKIRNNAGKVLQLLSIHWFIKCNSKLKSATRKANGSHSQVGIKKNVLKALH
jgi:hypothetical protein